MNIELIVSFVAVFASLIGVFIAYKKAGPESKKIEIEAKQGQLKLINEYETKLVQDSKVIKELNLRIDELEKCLAEVQQRMAELEEKHDDLKKFDTIRYNCLMAAIPIPVIFVNVTTGQIIDVNPKACELYEYSVGQMKQMNVVEISAEPDQTLYTINNKIKRVERRYHKKKNGKVFPVTTEMVYFDGNGDTYCVAVVTAF